MSDDNREQVHVQTVNTHPAIVGEDLGWLLSSYPGIDLETVRLVKVAGNDDDLDDDHHVRIEARVGDLAATSNGTGPSVGSSEPRSNDQERVTQLLIVHQRADAGHCLCGWGVLGASYAEHVAKVLADDGAIRDASRAQVAIDRTVAILEKYDAIPNGSGQVNIRQVLSLLHPDWPHGNFEAPATVTLIRPDGDR